MLQVNGNLTGYDWLKHFLVLGRAHGFVIYNDLSQWPKSDALTCWNPKGGASTIGYLMGSPSLISTYLCFEVKDGCTKDACAKTNNGLAKYQFTRETIGVYSCGIYNGMLELNPFAPLDEVTQGLLRVIA